MKHIIFLILLFPFCYNAQIKQIREVASFNKIEIVGNGALFITQSDSTSLKVIADEFELNNIYATVKDSILSIKTKGVSKKEYQIYVTTPNINQLTASGNSKINSTNILNLDSLTIDASGLSHIYLEVKSKKIELFLSGESQIDISGSSQVVQSNLIGKSSLTASTLITPIAYITVSGKSAAKVFSSQKINAKAKDFSTIQFSGNPKEVSAEASSSSSILKINVNDSSKLSISKDSTNTGNRKKKFMIIDKDTKSDLKIKFLNNNNFHHWVGFYVGINGWLSKEGITLPNNQNYMNLNYGKSINFQFNTFEENIHIYKNYINLVIGLGFEYNQYEFSEKTKLNPDSIYTFGKIDTSNDFNYKKNRLKTTFINFPLLLEFNTNKKAEKSFHIAFGVIAGYKLGSRTKQLIEQAGTFFKIVRKDNYNINPFRINAHASVGYNNFTLFANYSLTQLFENRKGPELYPFVIGIKLIPILFKKR